MPKTVHQWLILAGTDFLGIGASLVLGWLFMRVFLNPERLAGEFYGEHEVDKHKVDEHIGTRLQEWVGQYKYFCIPHRLSSDIRSSSPSGWVRSTSRHIALGVKTRLAGHSITARYLAAD